MNWLINGIADIILKPIEFLFANLLYGIVIKGLLKTLNDLDYIFNYILGSQIERILFGVVVKDGAIDFNFFASTSPLKTIYLICIGIGSTLLVTFTALNISTSIFKNKKNELISRTIKTTFAGSIVFFIPVVFLTILSLASSFIALLSGQNIVLGVKNINVFQSQTQNKVYDLDNAKKRIFNIDAKYPNLYKVTKKNNDYYVEMGEQSLNDIYQLEDIISDNTNANLIANLNFNKKAFLNISKEVYQNGDWSTKYQNAIENYNNVIAKLKPELVNDADADLVADSNSYFTNIFNLINNYKLTAFKTVQASDLRIDFNYKTSGKIQKESIKYYYIRNFQNLFTNNIYGRIKNWNNENGIGTDKHVVGQQINSLQALATSITFLKTDPHNEGGTLNLRNMLASNNVSPLVTTFYQAATGATDTDWENSSYSSLPEQSTGFLFFGMILLVGAIIVLILSILFAFMRVFDLALLFVISPIPTFLSPFDNGARIKLWLKATIGELICIFGIVITLRLIGPIGISFKKGLESSSNIFGSEGVTALKSLFLGLFYIAALIACYQSIIKMSTIFGIGDGILTSMNMSRARASLSNIKNNFGSSFRNVGKSGLMPIKRGLMSSSFNRERKNHGHQIWKNPIKWTRELRGATNKTFQARKNASKNAYSEAKQFGSKKTQWWKDKYNNLKTNYAKNKKSKTDSSIEPNNDSISKKSNLNSKNLGSNSNASEFKPRPLPKVPQEKIKSLNDKPNDPTVEYATPIPKNLRSNSNAAEFRPVPETPQEKIRSLNDKPNDPTVEYATRIPKELRRDSIDSDENIYAELKDFNSNRKNSIANNASNDFESGYADPDTLGIDRNNLASKNVAPLYEDPINLKTNINDSILSNVSNDVESEYVDLDTLNIDKNSLASKKVEPLHEDPINLKTNINDSILSNVSNDVESEYQNPYDLKTNRNDSILSNASNDVEYEKPYDSMSKKNSLNDVESES